MSTSCAIPPPPPPLPVPSSLQYGSSVWEAAIPLFSHPPLPMSAPVGAGAALPAPPHPVEQAGSKSLLYFSLTCPE